MCPSLDDKGKAAKIHKIANSGALPGQIIDFAISGERRNIMRQTIESLPSVASGIA